MNREKVIKGLEHCIRESENVDDNPCDGCPYFVSDQYGCDRTQMEKDALALLKEDCHNCKLECLLQKYDQLKEKYDELLKEQEAVEPTFKQDKDGIFVWACGSCGAYMYHIYDGIDKAKEYAKFCRQCGKAVKWDEQTIR